MAGMAFISRAALNGSAKIVAGALVLIGIIRLIDFALYGRRLDHLLAGLGFCLMAFGTFTNRLCHRGSIASWSLRRRRWSSPGYYFRSRSGGGVGLTRHSSEPVLRVGDSVFDATTDRSQVSPWARQRPMRRFIAIEEQRETLPGGPAHVGPHYAFAAMQARVSECVRCSGSSAV
jgi:hypothetical protein